MTATRNPLGKESADKKVKKVTAPYFLDFKVLAFWLDSDPINIRQCWDTLKMGYSSGVSLKRNDHKYGSTNYYIIFLLSFSS